MDPIELRFGGYQEPASIHNRAAAYFGEQLCKRLGDRVRSELIGSVLKLGRPSGDLPVMVEHGELDLAYMASIRFIEWAPELALFDLLFKENISKTDRERVKQASKSLLASLQELLRPMQDWTEKAATQAEVRVFILDSLYQSLPRPPFTEAETEEIAGRVYDYVWQRSASSEDGLAA